MKCSPAEQEEYNNIPRAVKFNIHPCCHAALSQKKLPRTDYKLFDAVFSSKHYKCLKLMYLRGLRFEPMTIPMAISTIDVQIAKFVAARNDAIGFMEGLISITKGHVILLKYFHVGMCQIDVQKIADSIEYTPSYSLRAHQDGCSWLNIDHKMNIEKYMSAQDLLDLDITNIRSNYLTFEKMTAKKLNILNAVRQKLGNNSQFDELQRLEECLEGILLMEKERSKKLYKRKSNRKNRHFKHCKK